MSNKVTTFFKDAFEDIKESAKAQHEVDKANFAVAKAESKAQFAQAKAMSNPKFNKQKIQNERIEKLDK